MAETKESPAHIHLAFQWRFVDDALTSVAQRSTAQRNCTLSLRPDHKSYALWTQFNTADPIVVKNNSMNGETYGIESNFGTTIIIGHQVIAVPFVTTFCLSPASARARFARDDFRGEITTLGINCGLEDKNRIVEVTYHFEKIKVEHVLAGVSLSLSKEVVDDWVAAVRSVTRQYTDGV
jgi:hypothetical protein